MKHWFIPLGFFLYLSQVHAQSNVIIPASYSAGNASVAREGDWIPFHNPALLEGSDESKITMLVENRFAVSELSTEAASVQFPINPVKVGVAISHFGFSTYSEMMVGLAVAHTFDKLLTLGIQFNYYSAYFSSEQGNKGTLLPQIGLLSELSPNFFIGFSAFNPTRQQIHYQFVTKNIPTIFNLGTSYRFSKDFVWLTQLSKALDSTIQWALGFEYQPVDILTMRLGGYGTPFIPTLGAGVKLNQFRVNVNFERHPVLGITSVGGLQYVF
jgi:hypothetical protein